MPRSAASLSIASLRSEASLKNEEEAWSSSVRGQRPSPSKLSQKTEAGWRRRKRRERRVCRIISVALYLFYYSRHATLTPLATPRPNLTRILPVFTPRHPESAVSSHLAESIDLLPKSIDSHCGPIAYWRSLCAFLTLPIGMRCGRASVLSQVKCGCRVVAVNVTPGGVRRARRPAPRAAPRLTDRAPRGAQLVTAGNNCGFPLVICTWLVRWLLKSLPFRQASRRQVKTVIFWPILAWSSGLKPRETADPV